MGLLFDTRKWLIRRWRRVFPTDGVESPLMGGNGEVQLAIYQSKSLSNRHGKSPEKTVARYLAENFDRAGIGYEIRFGYPPRYVNSRYEVRGPKGNPGLNNWANSSKPFTARDGNLLLYNIDGGGVAYLRGKHGLAPAGNIDRVPPFRENGEDDIYRNIRACLHEVGHMLGGKHKDNMFTKPSMVYNDSVLDDFQEYIDRNI